MVVARNDPRGWRNRDDTLRLAQGVNRIVKAIVGELEEVADEVLKESVRTAPVDTGALKRSHRKVPVAPDAAGRVREVTSGKFADKPLGWRVEAGGRSPGAGPKIVTYASAVHELHPTQAKWLELAREKVARGMARRLAAAGRRAAR